MLIDVKTSKPTAYDFIDVCAGQVFNAGDGDNDIWMRIETVLDCTRDLKYNAVNLEDGSLFEFDDDSAVYLIDDYKVVKAI